MNTQDSLDTVLHWEGPVEIGLVQLLCADQDADRNGLNARYLVPRKSTLLETLGALAATDQFTPADLKGPAYYAFLGVVLLASTMPFAAVYVPPQFEVLADAVMTDPLTRRRTLREIELVGILANRTLLTQALAFLCGQKILEPLGGGEYLILKRPIRKLSLSSKRE